MASAPERKYVVGASAQDVAIDVGLRQYMLRVYNYMTAGLVLTGAIALAVATIPSLRAAVVGTPVYWIAGFATLGIAFFFGLRIRTMRASTAQGLFWAYAGLLGLFLSPLLLIYTGGSVARVFFITAGTFAAMSIYGYTTRRDLTGIGSFLTMGMFGLFIALLVNIFLQSAAVDFALSVIGVLIFTGLTAYNTQQVKESYAEGDAAEITTKKAIIGAFSLYLDFINLFLFLLRLLGSARG